MVPSIAGNGASFRGAGLYYLHDKAEKAGPKLSTSGRVAWTATRNLANEDPEKAIDEMWHTAEDAARLKAGQPGRRCDDPVKTLSLAWAPHQSPTREQMEAAVDGYLNAMGWQEHQALLICHTDEPHPHVHLTAARAAKPTPTPTPR
jgi:relaxase-like protein